MTKTKFGLLAFIAVLAIAMVVRPPVAVMGPLLDEIQQSLHLSTQLVGFLAAAPVLCFGAGAFASPWIVRKLGVDHTMLWVLIGLIIASVERVFFGYLGLLIGTVAVGLSIAVANVLLPTIVRSRFPNHIPLVTGAYTTVVAITASLAATIAVPTSTFFGGWVSALLLWAFPMLLALLLWVPQVRRADPHVIQILGASDDHRRTLNRSPQAWAIVAFFGFQSVGFYAVLGWLPLALISTGLSPDEAGTFLGLTGAIGIPIGLLISSLLGKFKRLSWWAAGSSLLTFVGYLGLTLIVQTRDHTWLLLVCGVLSFGLQCTFPIALSLVGTRATAGAQTTQLSSMAQGWGYLFAAAASFAVGLLASVAHSYAAGFAFVALISLVQAVIGFYAGTSRKLTSK